MSLNNLHFSIWEVMILEYSEFVENKTKYEVNYGFECSDLNPNLFDYQAAVVRWALKKGKCALFEDTGLGKTIQLLSFSYEVHKHTNEPVLIVSPLAVAEQTVREGKKFGFDVNLCESQIDVINGINITNYEKLHKFNGDVFVGVVLDESSIIKNQSGKIKKMITEMFAKTKYKLCCTATPSPNDYTELGTHAEFLGVMKFQEMLATFFINDMMKKKKNDRIGWRLKKHAESEFFKWIASWAVMIRNPKDIGFNGDKYKLPKLNYEIYKIDEKPDAGSLFVEYAETFTEKRQARINSLDSKVEIIRDIVSSLDNCLIWCNYNDESSALKKALPEAIELKGSDTPEYKKSALIGFSDETVKFLISKPKICGFGMNWQHCNNMIFCGLSDSYEQFYQAIRRCYRFGQKKDVTVHIVISERELGIFENIKRKQKQHITMAKEMSNIVGNITKSELNNYELKSSDYIPAINMQLPKFMKG